jgi:hypothetical protein
LRSGSQHDLINPEHNRANVYASENSLEHGAYRSGFVFEANALRKIELLSGI